MLRGALQSMQRPREVTLVFGARREQDLYMLDAIESVRREWPVRFDFVPVLADEPTGSGWSGRRGLIADHLPEVAGGAVSSRQAYLCGPPGMIDSCVSFLRDAGVPDSAILFDKFLDESHLAQVKKVA